MTSLADGLWGKDSKNSRRHLLLWFYRAAVRISIRRANQSFVLAFILIEHHTPCFILLAYSIILLLFVSGTANHDVNSKTPVLSPSFPPVFTGSSSDTLWQKWWQSTRQPWVQELATFVFWSRLLHICFLLGDGEWATGHQFFRSVEQQEH